MRPRDKQGSELCGRISDQKESKSGVWIARYRCRKPLGHKSKEHIDGKYRWKEGER